MAIRIATRIAVTGDEASFGVELEANLRKGGSKVRRRAAGKGESEVGGSRSIDVVTDSRPSAAGFSLEGSSER